MQVVQSPMSPLPTRDTPESQGVVFVPISFAPCFQALSDVDNEGSGEVPWQDREVIIDGDGLVTLCPDLGYYEGPNGASGNNAATLSGGGGSSYQTMQARGIVLSLSLQRGKYNHDSRDISRQSQRSEYGPPDNEQITLL